MSTRAVGRLEHDRLPRPEAQHRAARHAAGKRRRIGGADDVDGVGAILEAQGDAQVRVGADLVADHAGRAAASPARGGSRGCGRVGRRRPAKAGTRAGRRPSRRTRRSRRRAAAAAGSSGAPPIRRRDRRPGASQQPLTAADLRVEADQGPLGETIVEVGHDTHRVRQVGTGVERRAALVVDEHERRRRRGCSWPPSWPTSVRSSSLLPAPVVPAIRACGPSPTRSISTIPSALIPIAAREVTVASPAASDRPPERHLAAMAIESSIVGEAAAGRHPRQRHRRRTRSRPPRRDPRGRGSGRVRRAASAATATDTPAAWTGCEPLADVDVGPTIARRTGCRSRSSLRHSGGTTPPGRTMATTATDGADAR